MLPSIELVRSVLSNVGSVEFFHATLTKLAEAYQWYLAPAGSVVFGTLVLLLAAQAIKPSNVTQAIHVGKHQPYELLALFTFITIPIFAYLAAKLTGAPFMARYGISCVAGFAGLLGIALARRPTIAMGVLFMIAAQIGISFIQFARMPFILEPSTNLALSTSVPQFMHRFAIMARVSEDASPIVLLDDLEFLPTFHYAPQGLASRLIYVMPSISDLNGMLYLKLRKCCNAAGNLSNLADFLASHDRFLVYGGPRSAEMLNYFIDAGAPVAIEHMSKDDFLIFVTHTRKEISTTSSR